MCEMMTKEITITACEDNQKPGKGTTFIITELDAGEQSLQLKNEGESERKTVSYPSFQKLQKNFAKDIETIRLSEALWITAQALALIPNEQRSININHLIYKFSEEETIIYYSAESNTEGESVKYVIRLEKTENKDEKIFSFDTKKINHLILMMRRHESISSYRRASVIIGTPSTAAALTLWGLIIGKILVLHSPFGIAALATTAVALLSLAAYTYTKIKLSNLSLFQEEKTQQISLGELTISTDGKYESGETTGHEPENFNTYECD